MFLRRLAHDRSGASAVEFALIAPILAVVVAMGWNIWQGETGAEHATAALRAGAEYYTAGGGSDAAAQSIALNAWQQAPSNASVAASRACYCAGGLANCSGTCTSGQPRTVFITLTVSGQGQGVFANTVQTQSEVVRVQ